MPTFGYKFKMILPASTTDLSARTSGVAGTPSGVISSQIKNFDTLFNSSNDLFADIGGNDTGEFEWRLLSYFGLDVSIEIEGRGSIWVMAPSRAK